MSVQLASRDGGASGLDPYGSRLCIWSRASKGASLLFFVTVELSGGIQVRRRVGAKPSSILRIASASPDSWPQPPRRISTALPSPGQHFRMRHRMPGAQQSGRAIGQACAGVSFSSEPERDPRGSEGATRLPTSAAGHLLHRPLLAADDRFDRDAVRASLRTTAPS